MKHITSDDLLGHITPAERALDAARRKA